MRQYYTFDADGRITGFSCPDSTEYDEPEGAAVESEVSIQTRHPHTHFVLNGEVTERPASPVSRTGPTLLDVPTGSTLYINGVSYPAEGEVEVLFTYPGTYALRVECFPYLDWNDEVVIP